MTTQHRAVEPDETGTARREDGVRIGWEVSGSGPTTILLMPTWTIVHSRFWKSQIPYLARHFRVVTFDGRGNGRSDRPVGAAAYRDEVCAADAPAVLDATGTDVAVVAGLSWGVTWALHLAAAHPERVLDAVPIARRQVDGLRFLVVTGPRIEPRSLPRRRGVTTRGLVPDLYRHLAAADLAVVQGGLTTCMELTARRTPFVYVPLRHHFEQGFHVRHRLERYRAGHHAPYEEASDPDALAPAIVANLGGEVDYRPVESDGAARAADLIADLL